MKYKYTQKCVKIIHLTGIYHFLFIFLHVYHVDQYMEQVQHLGIFSLAPSLTIPGH